MITVTGDTTLRLRYKVKFNMTEEQWDALSEVEQNELIDSKIDWHNEMRNAEVTDYEVDDVY